MNTVIEPDETMRHQRAVMIEAQRKHDEAAAEVQRAEDAQRRLAAEKAASERLETRRAKLRECESIARRLVDDLTEINRKLDTVPYLMNTEDLAAMLTRRAAIEMQLTSANAERPGLLKHFLEAEADHAKAKERLAEIREQ